MLVRERGDCWQLVRQPDHGDLSGQLARAWGGELPTSPRSRQLALAAARHDDGWAVCDRRPAWDPLRRRPLGFLDVPVPAHLACYRACIEVVTDEDCYAGALVAMHAVGLYNGRYGTQAGTSRPVPAGARAELDRFVAEAEARYRAACERLGIGAAERWQDYLLLQAYDRLSLAFCLREWESSDALPEVIDRVPAGGGDVELRIEPLGPWRVRLEPHPFRERPARFTLVRKLLLRAPFAGHDDFRSAYFGARTELVEIRAE
ncbi:MAG: DUF3891 family protein [Thermoleophilia bacterium]|nr:DUF3891 family protein [Thermoleophilia bacterium]